MKRLALISALALAVIELGFGQWLGASYGSLGIPRDYNRLFDVGNLYEAGGIARVTTDSNGLRGDFGSPDRIGLLVMGNGTVFEQYVDDDQTIAARLGQRFAESGCPRPTAAAGLNGQSTRGMIRRFDEWYPLIPGLRPQATLIYVGSNEELTEAQEVADTGRPPTARKRFIRTLDNNSAVARWSSSLARYLRPPKPTPISGGISGERWGEVPASSLAPLEQSAAGADAYRARLTELIRRVKATGARPIVVAQHAGHYYAAEGKLFGIIRNGTASLSVLQEARVQAKATMEACRATDALCIDMVDGMMPALGDYYDHVHSTPAGDQRIADFLFPRIKGALGCG